MARRRGKRRRCVEAVIALVLGAIQGCGGDTSADASASASAGSSTSGGGGSQSTSTTAGSQTSGTAGNGGSGALPPIETGLYAVVKVGELANDTDPSGPLATIVRKPYVHGISLSVAWADLEPTPGVYSTIVQEAVGAIRTFAASVAKTVTIKIHLRNGLPPEWLVPTPPDVSAGPVRFQTALGFWALATAATNGVAVTLIPTEAAYIDHVRANATELAAQIAKADPTGELVRIIQIPGPSSESGGTMRLTPREGFPRSGAEDMYGFHWTFSAHLQAWKDMGSWMANVPELAKRQWTFDLTHQAPAVDKNGDVDDTQFGLTTADQQAVADALAGAHAMGPNAVRLMNEGLAAQDNGPNPYPASPGECNWFADHFTDSLNQPESAIAGALHHEFQQQVPKADALLLPRFELARVALFRDPKSDPPAALQHTEFIEIHDEQVLDDAETLLDGTSAAEWYGCFDRMIKTYADPARVIGSADTAFWSMFPSPSNGPCQSAYPAVPPAGTCLPAAPGL